MLRAAYVATMRATARAADTVGLRQRAVRSNSRVARHAVSLLAIYDLPRMVELGRPWWVYEAAQEVELFLHAHPKARAFEFGAGASTVWLASRVAELHSVEHDLDFAEHLSEYVEPFPHVYLHAVPAGTRTSTSLALSGRDGYESADFDVYVSTIDDVGGQFDLIVIDGRARAACLEASIDRLAPGGIVVFDNSNRSRYRDAIERSGLIERRITGWCPSLPNRSTTSVLTASDR